jgi:hypothetical protein
MHLVSILRDQMPKDQIFCQEFITYEPQHPNYIVAFVARLSNMIKVLMFATQTSLV